MLAGRHPFDDDADGDNIIARVLRNYPHQLPVGESGVSDAARDLTRQLLKTDPDQRLPG